VTNRKRSRELADRKAARQAVRRAERRRHKQIVIGAVVGIALVIAAVAVFALGPSDETEVQGNSQTESPSSDEVAVDEGLSWDVAPGPDAQVVSLRFETNRGAFVVTTATNDAPETVGSMAFLADAGFFDGTTCHRLTTAGIYVLQCGDPRGDGTGGPGYALPDENLPGDEPNNYPAGTVAMANAGPGTSGSQFFVVYQDTTLPPGYSIWGTVTEGFDVIEAIAADGTADGAPDGPPRAPIVIESASTTRD
jgi:peptidyl-prolyl cis-trans isomerase B (cyclophilin B)